jgi:ABC-type sugar transport system permease subunit
MKTADAVHARRGAQRTPGRRSPRAAPGTGAGPAPPASQISPGLRVPHRRRALLRPVLLVPGDPRGRDRLPEVHARLLREWVGTANFTRVFHDPEFGAAWRNTLTFTLLALLIGFASPS